MAFLLCLWVGLGSVACGEQPGPAELLAQADRLRTEDHPRFLRTLELLHATRGRLSASQRSHLAFLDAWQTAYAGDYAGATRALETLDQRTHGVLAMRVEALLVHDYVVERRYERAYTLAYKLMAALPGIGDATARMEVMAEVIQMLNQQDQYDLALSYARQMRAAFPSGRGRCMAELYVAQTLLYRGVDLTPDSPEFLGTMQACLATDQLVYANGLRLDVAGAMLDNGEAARAIAFLDGIAAEVHRAGYEYANRELAVITARAHLSLGHHSLARRFAVAAMEGMPQERLNWISQSAYEVLYRAEKEMGRPAAALADYEKYVAQEKAAMDDTRARALAYQMVRQEVLAKKLRLDALGKQNRILQLRQELEHKAAETARLYVALLLALVGLIGVWLYRLKHSQLHFRRMARHDGLTGAYNRQHFLEEAGRTLERLQKAGLPACLAVLDLDHFKRINDTYGHAVGDDVLRHATRVAKRELRASDVFGRLGGEEFGVLMPACSPARGMEIAERLRDALDATRIDLEGGPSVAVSGSFGLACTGGTGYRLDLLLTEADAALYAAKRGGRNQVVAAGSEAVPETG